MNINLPKILLGLFVLLLLAFAVNIENLRNPFTEANGADHQQQINAYVIDLKRCPAAMLAEAIAPYFPDVLFSALEDSQQIIFTARSNQFRQIKQMINRLDRTAAQVAIEVMVLEIAENTLKEQGLITSLSSDGLILSDRDSLEAVFKMLVAEGKAYLLASPRIKSLCGKESMIHIGDKVPYTVPSESSGKTIWNVKYLDAGINLLLYPKKVIGNYLELELKPEVSSIKQWKMTQAGEYPIISTRMTSTLLRIKDKESIMIGGLLNEEEKQSITRLPIVSDIPLVGRLFERKVNEKIKTDIIFLVKAEIL